MSNLQLVTPVGRLVMGSLTEQVKKDHLNRPLSEDKYHYFIAIAVPKTEPKVNEVLNNIYNFALAGYANHPTVQARIQQGFVHGNTFKWKIEDGDTEHRGKEACAGSWIFKCRSNFPIVTCDNTNKQIDPQTIKRGYYVDIGLSIKTNGVTDEQAGIYLNPICVRLIGYGEEIFMGPSPSEIMGEAPPLPAGATATPIASSNVATPGLPAMGNGGNVHDQTAQAQVLPNPAQTGIPGQNTTVSPGNALPGTYTPHPGILNPGQ